MRRRRGRLFDLGDDFVGAALTREPVDEVAGEKEAELATDIGEIEAEIGNALAVDVHAHLRQIDFQVRVSEHELAAPKRGADESLGITGHLLGRSRTLQDQFHVEVSSTWQWRR